MGSLSFFNSYIEPEKTEVLVDVPLDKRNQGLNKLDFFSQSLSFCCRCFIWVLNSEKAEVIS